MTVRILRIGNSLAFLFFVVAMPLLSLEKTDLTLGLMKMGFFTLLLTPVCRLLYVAWTSLETGEFRARKWMVLVVMLLLLLSAFLGYQH